MKRLLVLSAALVAASAMTAGAQTLWTENFDSYADQAALNAVWETSGTPVSLTSDQAASAPNSVYQGTTAMQSRRAFGTPVLASQLDFSVDFYDEMGTGSLARAYAMVYARGGDGLWTDGLDQLIAVGKYNSVITPKYFARVAFGSSNWFVLEQGPDRSVGWHTARIVGNAANSTFDFYIDGILSGTAPLGADVTFDWVVLGSGLTSTHGMNFDNVSVGVVPEPGSLLALAGGLSGFAGLVLRRKA